MIKRAVIAGLTSVDPDAYRGWPGICPGCDIDARIFALLCQQQDIKTTVLINSGATKSGLLRCARDAYYGMGQGDLFVLYISSHGGQIPDVSGDEDDGMDETLCLHDGELADDVLGHFWLEIPAGVRVFFVTDTCNSGTNYRGRSAKVFRESMPTDYPGTLLHFGGCADGKSSFGSEQGGTFTTALIDAWAAAQTYAGWFAVIVEVMKRLSRNQVPSMSILGNAKAGTTWHTTKALE